ncbi:MAG: helix-turn-helix transcriptional regulator, partial [Clostridia bacterium]|nr:helix-turn-helix transcriptional regulator [Clostridia bacterium]
MNFSEILKILRKENDYTARELSSKINCSINLIYDWEHGRCEPSFSVLMSLAKIFDCSVDYLIGNSDDFGNVVPAQSNVTEKEARLLRAFNTLSDLEQDKLIADAEFYALRHRKFDPIKK